MTSRVKKAGSAVLAVVAGGAIVSNMIGCSAVSAALRGAADVLKGADADMSAMAQGYSETSQRHDDDDAAQFEEKAMDRDERLIERRIQHQRFKLNAEQQAPGVTRKKSDGPQSNAAPSNSDVIGEIRPSGNPAVIARLIAARVNVRAAA